MCPLHFLIAEWEAMTYRYISDVMDGARRPLRMLPGNARKTEYRRKALSNGARGKPRWRFPTTWLMCQHAGYWQSISLPKMEAGISKSAWGAGLHQPTQSLRAACETPPPELGGRKTATTRGKSPPYPAGLPIHPDGIQRARGHRPRSLEGGGSMCWDFPTHSGCRNPDPPCSRWKREDIKLRSLRPLIRLHLVRRGGHKSEQKIRPDDLAGYIQGLRLSLAEQAAQYVPKPPQ